MVLSCGHQTTTLTPPRCKPEQGPVLSSTARKISLADFLKAWDEQDRAYWTRVYNEGFPDPTPFVRCHACANIRTITHHKLIGPVAQKEPDRKLTPPPVKRDKSECWNCQQVADELCVPAVPLDLISLYRKPSELREWLTCYKGRLDGSEPLIPEYIDIVKALLTKFFYLHGDRIAARAAVDCIVVVHSTDRPPPHPLHTILEEIGLDVPVRGLMRRGNGDIGCVRPARDGFVSTESSPQRVLLADDVYASGAHVNSAAAALRTAGHTIAGSFVIARRINPDYREWG